jgi:hypothetical protein
MGTGGLEPPSGGDPRGEAASVLRATSAAVDADGETEVVLYWVPSDGVVGYNLYRTGGPVGGRAKRINRAKPIARVTSCAQLKAIIPEGSAEWKLLADGFTSLAHGGDLRATVTDNRVARFADRDALVALRAKPAGPLGAVAFAGLIHEQVDPCAALARGLTAAEADLFDTLAAGNLKIRLANGLAFRDTTVVAEEQYVYQLRGVRADGAETVLAQGVNVWAGHFDLPDPPSGLSTTAGDRKVLALWNRDPYAFGYMVRRGRSASGPFVLVNDSPAMFDTKQDLAGNTIVPPRPGFVDYQRWSPDGQPVSHTVNGVTVDGPSNGTIYYYEVASLDILGRLGAWSAAVSASPVWLTAPQAPTGLKVDPCTVPLGLRVSFQKVTRDVDDHQILDTIQTYHAYRAESLADLEDLSALPAHQAATFTANPMDPSTPTITWTDTNPVLAPPYGEKDFFYRLRCEDAHGNLSAPSAALAGRIPDTTPPGPTQLLGGEGHADHIRIYWKPNPEPDLAGYQMYRGLCDHGHLYRPKDRQSEYGCDMVLVGQVALAEAGSHTDPQGRLCFDDFSVPGALRSATPTGSARTMRPRTSTPGQAAVPRRVSTSARGCWRRPRRRRR